MPSPTRVAFIDHTAKLGGGEIALLHLVDNLRNNNYTPVVILFSGGALADKLAALNIETHILPLGADVLETRKDSLGAGSLTKLKLIAASLTHAFKLRKLLKSLNVKLVHTNSLKSDLIGGVAARLARLPVIWHIRDRIDTDYLPKPVVQVFRCLCRIIPTHLIANSAATLATLHLANPALATVVHDGTPPIPAPPPRLLTQAPTIGLIGRITPWKGQHIFLQAAAIVLQRFPHARFQIIGSALFNETDYEKTLHTLVDTLNIKPSVDFTGFRSDIPAAIADLDLVVHASTSGEPFGQVVIEGMIAAKPVIATNGGGVPEIIVHNTSGLLVPMADAPALAAAITQLLDNPTQAAHLGQQARQRVLSHFTTSLTAASTAAVFNKTLASP